MNNVSLEPITMHDFNNIKKLTLNIDVMKYVYQSTVWNEQRVTKYIQYCIEDNKKSDNTRTFYSYKIVANINGRNYFAGIIEYKPTTYYANAKFYNNIPKNFKTDVVLTILLLPNFQNKGIANKAINLLKESIKIHNPHVKYLLSFVIISNAKMLHVMQKYNFKFIKYLQGLKEKNALFVQEINN